MCYVPNHQDRIAATNTTHLQTHTALSKLHLTFHHLLQPLEREVVVDVDHHLPPSIHPLAAWSQPSWYLPASWSRSNEALYKSSSFISHATCRVGSMRLACPIERPMAGQSFLRCPCSLQLQQTGALLEGFERSRTFRQCSLPIRNRANSADKRCTCLESSESIAQSLLLLRSVREALYVQGEGPCNLWGTDGQKHTHTKETIF